MPTPSTESTKSGGWTLVARQKRTGIGTTERMKSMPKAPGHMDARGSTTNDVLDNTSGPVDQREIQRTLAQIHNCRERWRAARDSVAFCDMLKQRLAAYQQPKMCKAVIAGLGNLDPDTLRDKWRATWQLAVCLELMSAVFPASDNAAVPVFAQDPAFTRFDAAVLGEVGVQVLPGSQAVAMVDAKTFLFVPFVDAVVLLPKIMGEKEIGVYVGSDMQEIAERIGMEGYAEETHVTPELIAESLQVADGFSEWMEKVDGNLNSVDEVALFGLTVYVRKV